MSDYMNQLKQYESTLNDLKEMCNKAEKESIVAETNLQNLSLTKQEIIQECEKIAGVSIDKVPEMIEKKKQQLDDIMSQLTKIVVPEEKITSEKCEAISKIIKDYEIQTETESVNTGKED